MTDAAPLRDTDFRALSFKVGQYFRPASPIQSQELFAGRETQLQRLLDTVWSEGQHAVVYGERGVGKTSLVSVVQEVLLTLDPDRARAGRVNCNSSGAGTFGRLWRAALSDIRFQVEERSIGFSEAAQNAVASLAEALPPRDEDVTPDAVAEALRKVDFTFAVIFDEFDQIGSRDVAAQFAHTIKALSDYNARSTVVLVGVGDSVDELVSAHASVERAMRQIHMPRMTRKELREAISKAAKGLGCPWADDAVEQVVACAQGLPHYVHLLGQHSTLAALARKSLTVTAADVAVGTKRALDDVQQSTVEGYRQAVSSPRKESLFKEVLLACAMARTDEQGYFFAGDVRSPLRVVTGSDYDIPAFASHLNKFADDQRGGVLRKSGVSRRHQYKFRNPLLQPYVVIRGIADGLITAEAVAAHLTDAAPPASE